MRLTGELVQDYAAMNFGAGVRTLANGYPPLLRLIWSCGWSEAEGMARLQRQGWISDLCVSVYDVAPADAVRVIQAAVTLGFAVPAAWLAEAAYPWRIPRGFRCQCGQCACAQAKAGKDGHAPLERWAGVPSFTEWSEARALILGGIDNRDL